MSHAISKIPAVAAKVTALENAVSVDVQQLQLELAEITKALAANPSRVDASILNARKTAINTQLNQKTIDDK